MKTVIIYDQKTEPLAFIVAAGDLTKFDGVYINEYTNEEEKEALQDKLSSFLYDCNGKLLQKLLVKFPTQEVIDGAVACLTQELTFHQILFQPLLDCTL
jgi:hypothetical protein